MAMSKKGVQFKPGRFELLFLRRLLSTYNNLSCDIDTHIARIYHEANNNAEAFDNSTRAKKEEFRT